MTTLGQLLVRTLLRDSSDHYVVLDPHGWLQDPSFSATAEQYGIELVTAGRCTGAELERVRRTLEAAESGPAREVALIVNDADDADAWRRELGKGWVLRDVQPITVFPGLDPVLAGNLTLSEVGVLLAKYGGESRRPRSEHDTAWVLLEELHNIRADRVRTIDGVLGEAYRVHALGLKVPSTLIDTVQDDLPPALIEGVQIRECFVDPAKLLKAIHVATRDSLIDVQEWRRRASLLEARINLGGAATRPGRAFPWLPEIDDWTPLNEAEQEKWEARPLVWWLDKTPLLGTLAILRELDSNSRLDAVLQRVDSAFGKRIEMEYLGLQNTPFLPKPLILHRVPDYMAARHAEDRTALLIVDCLSIPLWQVLARAVREQGIRPSLDSSIFAWIPTMTTVSRQALLSGRIPRDFGDFIATTDREDRARHDYWRLKGVLDERVSLLKVADHKQEQVLQLARDSDLTRVAVVFNAVDDLVHATTDAHALTWKGVSRELLENWVGTNLIPAIQAFQKHGWVVFMTSDHGSHKVGRDLGNPREGIKVEQAGHRARIYSRDAFADGTTLTGEHWDGGNTLPDQYGVLLAPPGCGYGIAHGWSHGGAAWDEVIVPFVRFGGDGT